MSSGSCARERATLGATCVGESVLLLVPLHGTCMARVREHVFLCGVRPQALGNARVQMSSSEGRVNMSSCV